MDEKINLAEATNELCKHIDDLSISVDWALGEIARLRAENLELELKIKNQACYIRMLTRGTIQ